MGKWRGRRQKETVMKTKGTIVTVTIVNNPVTSFMYWEEISPAVSPRWLWIPIGEVTAAFDVIRLLSDGISPYPTSWQSSGRLLLSTDNTGNLSLYNYDGSSTNWEVANTFGGVTYDCARRYTAAADIKTAPRYFGLNSRPVNIIISMWSLWSLQIMNAYTNYKRCSILRMVRRSLIL